MTIKEAIADFEKFIEKKTTLRPVFADVILNAAAGGTWIPCSERMPKEEGRYLVSRHDYVTKTNFVDILWFEKNVWWNRRFAGDFAVFAWMPLPECYRGEKKGGIKA